MSTVLAQSTANIEIVKLEFSLKLPIYPTALTWSPDGETIALNGPKIHAVNVRARSVSGPLLTNNGADNIHYSPDGTILALQGIRLQLLSTADWRELAIIQSRQVESCWFGPSNGMAFTPDGRHIWIACLAGRGPFVALKLRVPDLTVEETTSFPSGLEFPNSELLSSNGILVELASGGAHQATNFRIRANGALFVESLLYTKQSDFIAQTPAIFRAYVAAINLIDRAVVLPLYDLTPAFGENTGVYREYLTSDHKTVLVHTFHKGRPNILAIDVASRQALSALDIPTGHSTYLPGELLLIPGTDLLIAVFLSPNSEGTVSVWNLRTGRLVQRLPSRGMLSTALSPDGTRFAGVYADQLFVYSLNRGTAL